MLSTVQAKYYAYELTKRAPSDSLEKLTRSLADAQVDLNPHQVEAALFAFRSPLSKGAILADEVGLGKTIEAGIVISQKWAEKKRRILIITPANLRKQWNQELLEKFFLSSLILESRSFNESIKNGLLNPFLQEEIVISSYQFVRSKEPYVSRVDWDLVVIDEAHRLRNVYKASNKIANSIKTSIQSAPKILLTATPLQNSLLELFGLVSIVDEHVFGDLNSFKEQFGRLTSDDNFNDLKERIRPVCQRTLRKQVREYVSFTNRIPITQEFYPSEEEQRLYDLVTEYLQRPNLFALPPSQRKLMTLILRKLLASSTYAISGTLEALSQKLDDVIASQETGDPEQMKQVLEEDYDEFVDYDEEFGVDEESQATASIAPEDLELIHQERDTLWQFYSLAYSIKRNSKGEVLRAALTKGFSEAVFKGGKRKAIIFTESRRTQNYLKELLEKTEFAGKIVLFNGTNTDPESREIYSRWLERHQGTDKVSGSRTADMRSALVDHFREEATIMIATEAAAEGINLQFCSLVVNYDLPWNPQRIEQRIGRCHRYGQLHDVVVVKFLNKANAADQRVYELLSDKFKLFDGVFGVSDEVLGSIESGVDFEKRIAEIYLQCRTQEEIQRSFDALQKELEVDIDERLKNARAKLLENFDAEVTEKLRMNLQQSKESLSHFESMLWDLTKGFLAPYAEFDSVGARFDLKANPFKDQEVRTGTYFLGKNITNANTYRVGHTIAQGIIRHYKTTEIGPLSVVFDYSRTGKKISSLEGLLGCSGYLMASQLTVAAFDVEDVTVLSGITDNGQMLEAEQCRRMLTLNIKEESRQDLSNEILEKLHRIEDSHKALIVNTIRQRNGRYFEREMEKLEKWAEDRKASLELSLKELDKTIKIKKTESKRLLLLEEKISAQREIKDMEKKRNSMRMELFSAQDEIEHGKEKLISTIEGQMQQIISKEELFTIRWTIV